MSATTPIATFYKIAVVTATGTITVIATINKNGLLSQERPCAASEQPVDGNFIATPFVVRGLQKPFALAEGFRLNGRMQNPVAVKAFYPELFPFFDFK